MNRRKSYFLAFFTFLGTIADAQQLPIFTQFTANELLFNPAFAGTKRYLDFRLTYRDQWSGFPDAPVTEAFSVNYSGFKNTGIAAYGYEDITGFTKRSDYTLCYAYRIHFPDISLAVGIAGSMVNYSIDESQITTNQTLDPAIDRNSKPSVWAPDASAGAYLYNDQWRIGLSVNNLIASTESFYKKYGFPGDTSSAGALKLLAHVNGYLSYIYLSANENFIWQNSLLVNYVQGAPVYIAYDLRCYIKNLIIAGFSISLRNDVSIEAGVEYHNNLQICYSYDYVVSLLSPASSNEITLIYTFDKPGSKDMNNVFKRRKYGYIF